MSRSRATTSIVRSLLGVGAVGAGCLAYAGLYEVNAFRLRRVDVPVLPPGARPVRVLHLSDVHLTPYAKARQRWLSTLGALEPDLVINTGDNLAHEEAVPFVLASFGRLLDRPGVYVWGSNDYYAPTFKNPLRYFEGPSNRDRRSPRTLPWQDLGRGFKEAGWIDLTHTRASLEIKGVRLGFRGTDDAHLNQDHYAEVAGPDRPRGDRCRDRRHPCAVPPSDRRDGVRRARFDHDGPYPRRPGVRSVLWSAGHQL